MNESFNMRNPEEGEVQQMHAAAQSRLLAKEKYKVLSQLLSGKKDVDVTQSSIVFEALNRERMEFETLMNLPQNQSNVNQCIKDVEDLRTQYSDGKYWNPHSLAKFGTLGAIPHCCYYSRPPEYWKEKAIMKEFFNMFPKLRVSTKRI